jgi:fructoselysine-6-P-deglycase FrlB-like protein
MIDYGVVSLKMSSIEQEIVDQPAAWRRAAALLPGVAGELPPRGARVAAIGCGTSLYMAQAFAVARESAGAGETDAFPASELPRGRRYDALLAISRSGTTTEVLHALERVPDGVPAHAVVGVAGAPVARVADHTVVLDFADEESVVQTRFATTALALLLAHVGVDVDAIAEEAEAALAAPLPAGAAGSGSFVFLGRGWTVGLANEAALKLREAALAWSEAYPALEYRHGPIALADARTLVWPFGDVEGDLLDDVRATGASVLASAGHPLADLVLAQRVAVALAQSRGLDPDRPRNLTRSVILTSS